jgi:hypothetical protein
MTIFSDVAAQKFYGQPLRFFYFIILLPNGKKSPKIKKMV